jgi:O-acetyl-ADP-ribose deacetylase (regulator of RNase III)
MLLCDQEPDILAAWREQFARWPEVEIVEGDPLRAGAEALLLPGNSFGFLDGGLELRAVETFGWGLQDELRRRVRTEFDGEILVGQATVLRLGDLPRPVVYAPIWRTPASLVGTVNVFLAVRGALLAASKASEPAPIPRLVVPALGVAAPGELDPRTSARQIRYAYEMALGHRGLGDKNLSQLARRQRKLQSVPGAGGDEAS